MCLFFFFFNDTATTEIYTLSLHDALPISQRPEHEVARGDPRALPFSCHPHERPRLPPDARPRLRWPFERQDRKSTRLNSSHGYISYAVFCLKKKNSNIEPIPTDQHHEPHA